MTTIIFPIPPEVFWTLTLLVGIMLLSVVIYMALPRDISDDGTKTLQLKSALGAANWPEAAFALVAFFWTVLALCLFSGLVATIGIIGHQLFFAEDFVANRFPLIQMAALTATLGAVVALPFTVLRLKLTQEQTETAKAALFNDKITEAATDLHAQRQVSKETEDGWETVWEDDVVRRNTAIETLVSIVLEEEVYGERVLHLISQYIIEVSREFEAELPHESLTDSEKLAWSEDLRAKRTDLENAVKAIGRLKSALPSLQDIRINLRYSNLQAMVLNDLNFDFVDFSGSNIDATLMINVSLRQTFFGECSMTGTILRGANLTGSHFFGTELELAELDKTTCFDGAAFQFVEIGEETSEIVDLAMVFADGSIDIAEDKIPKNWENRILSYEDFHANWRAFAASKNIDIPA